MPTQKSTVNSHSLLWACFLIGLSAASALATRAVLVRAEQMKAADTSPSRFFNLPPGAETKLVVGLDSVAGTGLSGTALERETDTVYRRPAEKQPPIFADIAPETSVVMGKPADIAAGAVVQLAGTVDANHHLNTKQIVILTGYVRVLAAAK